jgi:hypothetical protein
MLISSSKNAYYNSPPPLIFIAMSYSVDDITCVMRLDRFLNSAKIHTHDSFLLGIFLILKQQLILFVNEGILCFSD